MKQNIRLAELIAECLTVKGDPCVFPFSYQGEVYDACTREDSDNGAAWCAVQVIVCFIVDRLLVI
jgi:hypothetical protein